MNNNYNGWKNRQTWSVALWINNEEHLYRAAVEFMKNKPERCKPYIGFIDHMGMRYDRTPDNIKYVSTRLDCQALNDMMRELIK